MISKTNKDEIGLVLYYNPDYIDGREAFLIFIHTNKVYICTDKKSYNMLTKPNVNISIDNIDMYAEIAGFIKVLEVAKKSQFKKTKERIEYYNGMDESFLRYTNAKERLEKARHQICRNSLLYALIDKTIYDFQHMMSVLIRSI